MGGKGSGGRRVGSGAKPKDATVGALSGSRRVRARNQKRDQNTQNQNGNQNQPSATAAADPVPGQGAAVPDVVIPPPPGNLTLDELAVWNELAPLAVKEGTLTEATMMALRDLCEAIVLKRRLLRTVDEDGVTVFTPAGAKAAHPLLPQFRGLMQRVESGMMRFKLSPLGKELPSAGDKAPDPFAEFDNDAASAPGATTH